VVAYCRLFSGKSYELRENVGILAIEVYFPSTYVDQGKLEEYDGVSKGKYTIGLGQTGMGFCGDREDTNSLSLQKLERKLDFLDLSILKNYIIYFLTNSPTESWVPYNITVAAYCRLFLGKSYEFLANTVQEIKKEDSKEDVLYNK
jgi:hypothetical protein